MGFIPLLLVHIGESSCVVSHMVPGNPLLQNDTVMEDHLLQNSLSYETSKRLPRYDSEASARRDLEERKIMKRIAERLRAKKH